MTSRSRSAEDDGRGGPVERLHFALNMKRPLLSPAIEVVETLFHVTLLCGRVLTSPDLAGVVLKAADELVGSDSKWSFPVSDNWPSRRPQYGRPFKTATPLVP